MIDRVQQRTVPAASAPPAAPPGASGSPFDMARQYRGSAPLEEEQEHDEKERRDPPAGGGTYLLPRARKVLEACGPLTEEQLAEGTGAPLDQVQRMVKKAITRKIVERATDKEGRAVVQLKPPKGLKTYLARKGSAKPAKRAPAKSAAKKKPAPTRATRKHVSRGGRAIALATAPAPVPAAPPPVQAEQPPEFACGLLSTGVLVLEIAGQEPVRLKKAWVRDLVAYLDRIGNNSPETLS